jgi:glutamate 5-kinase
MDLETAREGDKITAIGQNRLVHWYDYYFLAYGYHTIQNNLLTEKNQRTVFYINKIALE